MTATLFDLTPYHADKPPDPNAPMPANELLECIAEAGSETDFNRLNWLFMYLVRNAISYSKADYALVVDAHNRAVDVAKLSASALDKSLKALNKGEIPLR